MTVKGQHHTEVSKLKMSMSSIGGGLCPIPIGSRFGRLTVIGSPFRYGKYNHYRVKCKCDCGTIKDVEQTNLRQDHTISCGCLWNETVSGHNRLAPGESAFGMLYNNYKARAKRLLIEFSLSRFDFKNIVLQNCHYCGREPAQKINSKYNGPFTYNGIDRMENAKGYTLDNAAPCCWRCNDMKKIMSRDEFVTHIGKIYLRHHERQLLHEERC